MSALAEKKCTPCSEGGSPLNGQEVGTLMAELGGGWAVSSGHHLEKTYKFSDFMTALAFTNRVGEMAEQQGHHPDIHLAWGQVRVTTWTPSLIHTPSPRD